MSTTLMEGEDEGDTSTESGADVPSGDGDGDDDGDGDGEPAADPCGCEDGQLCVGDCLWLEDPNTIQNPRCIDGTLCEGWYSPPCIDLACGSPFVGLMTSCAGVDSTGYDLLCNLASSATCDETLQDCPDNEKCVPELPDRWGYLWARCVFVSGVGMPGEPCTSEGFPPIADGYDSCDGASLCWNGSLTGEPFEGTCQPFCDGSNELACPDGMSCEQVAEGLQLCMPSP